MTLARTCSRCGTPNVQSLSMVYASGTTQTQTSGMTLTSTSYGNGQSGLGVGGYQSSSTHQNALAAAAAPPDIHNHDRRQEQVKAWKQATQLTAVAVVVGVLLWGARTDDGFYIFRMLVIFGTPVLLAAAIGWAYHDNALTGDYSLDRRNQRAYDIWTRSFLCLSCGDIGVTAETETQVQRTSASVHSAAVRPAAVPSPIAPQLRSAEDHGFQLMPSGAFHLTADDTVRFTLPGVLLKWDFKGKWRGLGRTPLDVSRPPVAAHQIYGVLSDDDYFYVSSITRDASGPILPTEQLSLPSGWQHPTQPKTASPANSNMESQDLSPGSYVIQGNSVRFTVPGLLFRQEEDGQLTPLGRTPVEVPRPAPGVIRPYAIQADDGRALVSLLTHDGEAITADMSAEEVAARRAIGSEAPASPNRTMPDLDRLAQLGQLRREGLLTDTEFINLKGQLLG